MDSKTAAARSANMKAIRSNDTKPEMFVRHLLFAAGYRYRLHVPMLAGKPDIVLAKYKAVIFINGCFWHQHPGCPRATIPSSNQDYWLPKLHLNVERDAAEYRKLQDKGWRVLVVWECACRKSCAEKLQERIKNFITGTAEFSDIGRKDLAPEKEEGSI